MGPIINKHFDCVPNIYVAYPENHTSLYHDLYLEFGVNIIPASGMYSMGSEDYTVTPPDGIKFDCVYLAGHETNEEFNASDIKADFAQYCTEDFDLIDHYGSDRNQAALQRNEPFMDDNRLVGETKDFGDIFDFISTYSLRQDNFKNGLPTIIRERLTEALTQAIKVY